MSVLEHGQDNNNLSACVPACEAEAGCTDFERLRLERVGPLGRYSANRRSFNRVAKQSFCECDSV